MTNLKTARLELLAKRMRSLIANRPQHHMTNARAELAAIEWAVRTIREQEAEINALVRLLGINPDSMRDDGKLNLDRVKRHVEARNSGLIDVLENRDLVLMRARHLGVKADPMINSVRHHVNLRLAPWPEPKTVSAASTSRHPAAAEAERLEAGSVVGWILGDKITWGI